MMENARRLFSDVFRQNCSGVQLSIRMSRIFPLFLRASQKISCVVTPWEWTRRNAQLNCRELKWFMCRQNFENETIESAMRSPALQISLSPVTLW